MLNDWCPVAGDDEVFFYPEVGKTWLYRQSDSYSSSDGFGEWHVRGTIRWTVTSVECRLVETHFTIREEGEGTRVDEVGSPWYETTTEYRFSREISGKLVGSQLFLGRYASGDPVQWRYSVSEPDTIRYSHSSGCRFGGCDVYRSISLVRGEGIIGWHGGGFGRARVSYSIYK